MDVYFRNGPQKVVTRGGHKINPVLPKTEFIFQGVFFLVGASYRTRNRPRTMPIPPPPNPFSVRAARPVDMLPGWGAAAPVLRVAPACSLRPKAKPSSL